MLGQDLDPLETQEWLEAFKSVARIEGDDRAKFLLSQLMDMAHKEGMDLPTGINTSYLNSISKEKEVETDISIDIEERILAIIRWNAMVMVVKANQLPYDLGGHIASFSSSATLYEVGFNHFYRGPDAQQGADLIFFQGHIAPGIYSRSFLEGRITQEQMLLFRQEAGKDGLSSYPHPWLMPDFWQFPTVSMGLGPIMAIYQARFMKYLHHREIKQTDKRSVWMYLGDGEMDEPESLGAISMAGREKLDNLIFVINCNLQRLDGPVRGNGKIIQELEGMFHGAGWNVLKVIWGGEWDKLLAKDTNGLLKKRMEEVVDGEYQAYKAKDGAYVRKHFFGKYPELLAMVEHLSDDEIYALNRGGHDPFKVFQVYYAAKACSNKPTVILAKTVKGYGMGEEAGEGQNTTHSQKRLGLKQVEKFAKRFNIPVTEKDVKELNFYKPAEDSEEMKYMNIQRQKLGGSLPMRSFELENLQVPGLDIFSALLESTGERKMSTTMVLNRIMALLVRDKQLGSRIVPIIPDEARTFGMEGLFRQLGIYSASGQLYQPEDSDKVMWYKEDKKGQVLQEGINEAGAISDWIAAATSYATHNTTMIPFYIYYSKFGFQRVGDLAWAAGDMQAKGFLIGGTAGRTTLNGEGLQHQDGDSHLAANIIPNCISYDPTYAYELTVIIQSGLHRMYENHENIFYYITTMNELYTHPKMPAGMQDGIIKGIYLLKEVGAGEKQVQLMGCGTILREVEKAAQMLANDWGVKSNIWSVTSFNELTREAQAIDRENRFSIDKAKMPYITQCLADAKGPVIATTDYMRNYAEQVRKYIPSRYEVLGTDGFGRSDSRAALRDFFEVDANYVTITALKALVDEGKMEVSVVTDAIKKYGVDIGKPNPMRV